MTRNVSDSSLASVRAELLGVDDDEGWLELGDIQALDLDGDEDDEPVLAQGSDIHILEGRPEYPERESSVLRYLLGER